MEELYFSSVEELYARVTPALNCKKKELAKLGYSYIPLHDIWNAVNEIKWHNSKAIALCDIVDDILNTDNKEIDLYYRNKIANQYQEKDIELPKLKNK